jgi:hypothetical protein
MGVRQAHSLILGITKAFQWRFNFVSSLKISELCVSGNLRSCLKND